MKRVDKGTIFAVSIAVLVALGVGATIGSFFLSILLLLVLIFGCVWLLPKISYIKS